LGDEKEKVPAFSSLSFEEKKGGKKGKPGGRGAGFLTASKRKTAKKIGKKSAPSDEPP